MKKFLTVLLAIGIIFGSFATVDAAARIRGLWGMYENNGLVPEGESDYFTEYEGEKYPNVILLIERPAIPAQIHKVKNPWQYADVLRNADLIILALLGGGNLAHVDVWRYNGNYYYVAYHWTERDTDGYMAPLYSNNPCYNIVRSYFAHEEASRRNDEEQRQRAREAQEKKRREEAARKNEFYSLIAGGDQAYSAKDYSTAIQNYDKARNLDEDSVKKFVEELTKNGDNLIAQKNYPAALDYYKKAFVMNSADSSARKKLWDTYTSSNNFSDAANFYQTMTTLRPKNAYFWFELGYSLDELKDYESAITAYTHAANLDPDSATYNNRGVAYKNLGRYYETIQDFKSALKIKPNAKDTLGSLWDAYCKSGKFDDAVDFYTKRVTSNKNDDDAWFKLGWSLNKLKKFPDAIKAMQKAIKLKPTAFKYYWFARVYENAGKKKDAIDACQKALKIDPKHADAENLLAELKNEK